MKEQKLGLILLATLTVLPLISCSPPKEMQVEKHTAVGFPSIMVLYTTEDIPEGTALTAELLKEREVDMKKLPQDAVTGGSPRILGRKTKFRMLAGQILRYHDLLTEYGSEENIVILSKEEQEKLVKMAAHSNKSASQLLKTWALEHLQK